MKDKKAYSIKNITNFFTPKNIIWLSLFFLPEWISEKQIFWLLDYHNNFFIQPWATLFGLLFLISFFIKSGHTTKCQILKWSIPIIFLALKGLEITSNWRISFSLIFLLASFLVFCCYFLLNEIVEKYSDNSNDDIANTGLLTDDPINSFEIESYKRKEYARSVVNEIHKTNTKRAFNIAISGKWGSGKTSFMNLIKVLMDEKYNHHFISVNYNPWDFKEEKFIDLDLLKAISHKLSHEKEIEDSIKKLFLSLQGVTKQPWYKLFSFLISDDNKSIQDYRDEIGKILKRKNKKLVIFLDDLDRLEDKEILEVFKTIRNSFDIANTFFILGFDIDYVSKQIENKDPIHYMEKIFQMRLNMPSNESFDFNNILSEIIFKTFNYKSKTGFNYLVLKNMRDVNAIINSLKVFFNNEMQHIGDYDLDALVIIEWIKLKNPTLYEFLAYNPYVIISEFIGPIYESVNGNTENNPTENGIKKYGELYENLVYQFLSIISKEEKKSINKIKTEYSKYFTYALLPEEFSDVYLLEAVKNRSDEIVSERLNDFNKINFVLKIDKLLKNMAKIFPEPEESRIWMMRWQFKILYEENTNLTYQKPNYYINQFSNYKNIEELNQIVTILRPIQKLNFTLKCDDITDSNYLNTQVTQLNIMLKNSKEIFYTYYEIIDYFLFIKKEIIDISLITEIKLCFQSYFKKDLIRFIKPYIREQESSKLRSIERVQKFELRKSSIFSAGDWLSYMPQRKEDIKLNMIKKWLTSINVPNSSAKELHYETLYGERYSIIKDIPI